MALTSKGWIDKNTIDTDLLTDLEYIYNNRHIITTELHTILKKNVWPLFYVHKSIKNLLKSDDYDIQDKNKINSINKPCWRLFVIFGIFDEQLFVTKHCPRLLKNTIKMLKKSSVKIRGAAFSLLEPGYVIDMHQDNFCLNFYRVHIPLLIPSSNNNYKTEVLPPSELNEKLAIFQVENDYRLWKDNNWLIIDTTYMHGVRNNSDELRIILILDIFKN